MPPTPEDWARIRHAYEHGDRPIDEICAAYGISSGTLRDRVRRWGWTRRRQPIPPIGPAALAPPRAMIAPAFAARDEAAAMPRGEDLPQTWEPAFRPSARPVGIVAPEDGNAAAARPRHEDPGSNGFEIMNAIDAASGRDAGGKPLDAFPHPAADAGPDASAPPAYSRFVAAEAEARGEDAEAPSLGGQLRGAIARIMPAIERTLATLSCGPLPPRQMELAARSLGTLTRTLRELNGLLAQQAADAWEPTDMEAFRQSLAEEMDAMIRQREDEAPRIYHAAWEELAQAGTEAAAARGGCEPPPSS